MADISFTAANIRPYNSYQVVMHNILAGATANVGQCVYIDSNADAQLAMSDGTAAQSRGRGIIVESYDGETAITNDHRCSYVAYGPVAGFSGMTPGGNVYVSDTPGGLTQDAPSGEYSHKMGYALTATVIWVEPCYEDTASVA